MHYKVYTYVQKIYVCKIVRELEIFTVKTYRSG